MRITRLCLLVAVLLLSKFIAAQELTVKSVSLQPSDMTAKNTPVLDLNGDTCALVKIQVDLEGLQFTNKTQYVGDVKYVNGTYLLYKSPHLSRMISYQHADYLPGQIDLSDYGYKRLRGGKTYLVVMEAPVRGIGKSLVVLKVQPATATVTFNNRQLPASATGVYECPVGEGTYSYLVESPDYKEYRASVTVAKAETKTQSIRLQPITHSVNVNCNVSDAHVFVDNIDYGRVGKVLLPQGQHSIRIQAEGYLDIEEAVTVSATTGQLTYRLKKNENRIDIHATPVTIISASKRIYKNNKELKGWRSGVAIKFMPGTYLISDDDGNEREIKVGTKPMKVEL